MNTLLASIFSEFTAGTDLYTALGGRLYYDRAPADNTAVTSYGVYMAITSVGEDTFTETIEEVGIQFSFFADTLTEINNLVTHCMTMYHDKKLSTGNIMQRELVIPARRSGGEQTAPWQADIEFFVKHEV